LLQYATRNSVIISSDWNEQSILIERRPGLNETELQPELTYYFRETYDKVNLLTFKIHH